MVGFNKVPNQFSMSVAAYFDLKQSFKFYGAFHSNTTNKIIHIICVPLIFTTSIELLARIAPLCLVNIIFLFYVISFTFMDPMAGLAYAPVLTSYYFAATTWFAVHSAVSVWVFVVAWLAQFIGHALFEKRAPALLTNLPQALHAAVFFVWLEAIFSLGFRADLRIPLEAAVREEMSKRQF